MMARKQGWFSVGIRCVVIATLFLAWNHRSVDAGNKKVNPVSGSEPAAELSKTPLTTDEKLAQLAVSILDGIYTNRHKQQIQEVEARIGKPLSPEEIKYKQYMVNVGIRNPTDTEVREHLIDYMQKQKNMQTIAIGLDENSGKVVIAGNIKDVSFKNMRYAETTTPDGKTHYNVYPEVKFVGFRETDFAIIQELVRKEFIGFGIEVIRPSNEDLSRIPKLETSRKNYDKKKESKGGFKTPTEVQIELNGRCHFYHAEMQILTSYGDKWKGIKIGASKPYCKNCDTSLPPEVKIIIQGDGYGSDFMRWKKPNKVVSEKTIAAVKVKKSHATKAGTKKKQPEEETGSKRTKDLPGDIFKGCNRRRRRRSSCSRHEDVTEVDADKFGRKLVELSEADGRKFLAALDRVGMDKLKGSESARKDIKSRWKKWKSSVVKGVINALSKGAVIAHLVSSTSNELSKTAISPKILADSLDRYQKESLKSAAEKKKGGENIDENAEGFGTSYKVVKAVNLGMLGKNLIGGVLNGDTESLITMATLLGADQIYSKAGEKLTAKGIKLANTGKKAIGSLLKVAGPIVGTVTSAFSIYSLVGHVNQISSLKEMCKSKDNLFQERFEKDCKFDMDAAIAETVTDVIGIVSTVATVFSSILKAFSVATGPLGVIAAVVDLVVSVGAQIYVAVQEVNKISSSLIGGLTGTEKFWTGMRKFFGMDAAKHIQNLLEIKESYNSIVAHAVEILKNSTNFQTYVLPTNHTRSKIQINCKDEARPTNAGRVFAGIFSFGLTEIYYTRPVQKCDTQQEIEEDNEADFQNFQQLNQFRVEPDTPSWGILECKPNSLPGRYYPNDPQYVGSTHGFLCHNLIAMSAQNRSDLPVLFDLKDGTDSVLGFRNRKHVFLLGEGFKKFTGGSADDVFVIKSFPFRGNLDGAGGRNTLVLDTDGKNSPIGRSNSKLIIDAVGNCTVVCDVNRHNMLVYDAVLKKTLFFETYEQMWQHPDFLDLRLLSLFSGNNNLVYYHDLRYPLVLNDGVKSRLVFKVAFFVQYFGQPRVTIDLSSCEQCVNQESSLKNFHQIIGRSQKPDSLVTDCTLTYVDLNGGESQFKRDEITIPASNCSTNATFQLRAFTKIDNHHTANGEFTYLVEYAASILANLDPETNVHRIIFTADIVTAQLFYQSGYIFMTNRNEKKEFKCNYIKSKTFKLLLMTQQGLSINYDEDSGSFYGLVPPSHGEKQEVRGLVNYPNRFITSTNVTLKLTGGSKEDIFSLTGPIKPKGSMDGSGGFDTIIMQQDFQPGAAIAIDLLSKVLSPGQLRIIDVESIIGRAALSEVVKVSCELKYLDLGGGNAIDIDLIQFPPQLYCQTEMTLMVRRFTTVQNFASSGNFSYQLQVESLTPQTNFVQVDLEVMSASHKYIFLRSPSNVSEIKFDEDSKELVISFGNDTWTGNIPLERSEIYIEDKLLVQILPQVHGIVRVQSNNTSANEIHGLRTYPNTFVVGMTSRESSFTGGQMDDTFFITSDNFHGKVDGSEGINTLYLTDSLWDERVVIVDVGNNSLAVKSGDETDYQLEFNNIQRLFGREGQADVILPGCYTQLIDTKGGRNGYDFVHILSSLDCYSLLDVAIRPKLIVLNDATDGEFKYEGDFQNGGGSSFIFLTFTPFTQHKVYLDMDFVELINLKLDEGRVNMTAADKSDFSVDFFIPEEEDTHTSPSISFKDGLELKISQNGPVTSTLFGTLRNVSPSDLSEFEGNTTERIGLIQRYRRAAKDTQTSVMMQIESDKLVSIGSGGDLDVLTAVPGYSKNILVANDANETIYRIANGSFNVHIIFDLESPGPKLLDLTPIVKDNFEIYPKLQASHDKDLLIQIKDVEITVKGLANASYEYLTSWQVLLREVFLNIEEDSGIFKLVAQPIVIDPKTFDNFVVHAPSLEYDMKILTTSNNLSIPIKYEAVKQGDNLVFTNLFQRNSSDEFISSVVFYGFYNETAPEAHKRVMLEVEEGVMLIVTEDAGKDIPTFEQREMEEFGQPDSLQVDQNVIEPEELLEEQEMIQVEQEGLSEEQEMIQVEQEGLSEEQEMIQVEQEGLSEEQEMIQVEPEELSEEQEMIQVGPDVLFDNTLEADVIFNHTMKAGVMVNVTSEADVKINVTLEAGVIVNDTFDADVTVNLTLTTTENLPTLEQEENAAVGRINPLFFILPILAAFLIGSIVWFCWYKKLCKALYDLNGEYQLAPTASHEKLESPPNAGTRSKIHEKTTACELMPLSKPEKPSMDI